MFPFLLSIAAASPSSADLRLSRMADLYETVCLKAFPDDKAIEKLMSSQGARELSPAEVKVTMRDDPARGWRLGDGTTVWIEFPPFHACSVRWSSPEIGDDSPYRRIADRYENELGGFQPVGPLDADHGPIHIHATGEQRQVPEGGAESLFFFVQQISDPKRRAAGEIGYTLRFVHQFAPPRAKSQA